MLIFYLLLFVVTITAARYTRGFNREYLAFDTTNTVKGFFILLVFISHVIPYTVKSGAEFCNLFWLVHNRIGQWIVAMFLFYSGYGIMESIKKKGNAYIAAIPKHRIFNTLLNFDVAVLAFIVVSIFVGADFSLQQYLLAFTGWETVGNSNWYIFIILLCYVVTFIAFSCSNNRKLNALVCLLLSLLMIVLLGLFKQDYWYNTMLCYSAGIFFSLYREKTEDFIQKKYWVLLLTSLVLLVLLFVFPYSLKGITYNAFSIVFCAMVLLLTMKFKIKSSVLQWCGNNLFPLYIYQRIPMIVFASISGGAFVADYPLIYTLVCLIITVIIAYLYRFWAIKL